MDSLDGNDPILSPLYLSDIIDRHYGACCEGDVVDLFKIQRDDRPILDNSVNQQIMELTNLIKDSQKKFQTIKKNWGNGYKEKIIVYLTPISGLFCRCRIAESASEIIGHRGFMYFPKSGFELINGFWESNKSKIGFLSDLTKENIETSPF